MATFSVQRKLGLCSPGLATGGANVSPARNFERHMTLLPLKDPSALLHKAGSLLHSEFLGALAKSGRAQTSRKTFRGLSQQSARVEASAGASSTSFRCTQQLSTPPEKMTFGDVSRRRIQRRCRCRAASRGSERNGSQRNGQPETATNGAAEAAPDGANRAKGAGVNRRMDRNVNVPGSKFRSSWDAKDSTGRTYIENLGKASENVNVVVGAKAGMVDSVFVGDVLGQECEQAADF